MTAAIFAFFSDYIEKKLVEIQNRHSLNQKKDLIEQYESFLAKKSTDEFSPETLSKLKLKYKKGKAKRGVLMGDSDLSELEDIASKQIISLKRSISRSGEILNQITLICNTALILLFLVVNVGYYQDSLAKIISNFVEILGMAYLLEEELLLILKVFWYLFVQFPFEEGDRLLVDGIIYQVKRIELWRTTFIDDCNMVVYMANWNLIDYSISNLSRAGPMWEPFSISVNINSLTDQKLEKLDKKMHKFFQMHNGDISRPPQILPPSRPTRDTIKLNFILYHRDNFGDEECRSCRSKAFTFFIQAELVKMNIKISSPSYESTSPKDTMREAHLGTDDE